MNAAGSNVPETATGVRVFECVSADSGIAAAYGGWLLARMGARVTRLVAPSKVIVASADPGTHPLRLAEAALAVGKDSLPMPQTSAAFEALVATGDMVLTLPGDCLDLVLHVQIQP